MTTFVSEIKLVGFLQVPSVEFNCADGIRYHRTRTNDCRDPLIFSGGPSGRFEFLARERKIMGLVAIERLALVGDIPIEWRTSLIRGDRYSLVAQWPPGPRPSAGG